MSSADPWNDNDIVIEYRRLRDFDATLSAWSRAVELDADYGEALYYIELVHQLDIGDPRAAIPYWHRAIAAGENSAVTMAHLANAYCLSGRRAESLYWQGQLLEYQSDSPKAPQIRAMLRSQGERL